MLTLSVTLITGTSLEKETTIAGTMTIIIHNITGNNVETATMTTAHLLDVMDGEIEIVKSVDM